MSFLAPPGTVIVLALACLTFLQASQAARFPRTVDEALQDYPQRRDDLIQVYVELTETQPLVYTFPQSCRIQGDRNGRGGSCRPKKGNASHPFGAFNQTGSQHSFRRMAAWLLAYKKRYQGRGDYRDLITNPKLLLHAPEMVFDWTKTIYKFARTGTDTNGGETDYDMVMKEMISFLYLFQHEPTLLTDDAAFNILDKGLVYRGNDWGSHMRWKIATQGTWPETENHVLMTLSSMYLTNQWIYNNPRNDSRLSKGAYSKRSNFKNSNSFEDILLQAIGRIVHSDYFETNARPYQVFSLHSLFNLCLFADSAAIRNGARNAIDFTLTKFAFQSFEGKRLAPQRRQSSHRNSMSIYANDATVFMAGMLSGYYSWNDTVALLPDSQNLDLGRYFPTAYSGNGMGHMLWGALFQDHNLLGNNVYTVPRSIHDFMLRKRQPYWARMQARFYRRNYAKRHWPRYFAQGSTAIWADGPLEFAAELYYGASHVLNVAGGRHNDYPLFDDRPFDRWDDKYLYDFTHKPSYIMPRGHVRDWGEGLTKMAEDTLLTTSGSNGKGNNLGTYKGFTWGYAMTTQKGRRSGLAEPFVVPNSWLEPSAEAKDEYISGEREVRFRFYDRTTWWDDWKTGYYLVTGGLKDAGLGASHRVRGFWEVIPAERFPSLDVVREHVLRSNPSNTAFSPSAPVVKYNSTTGEVLELFQDAGFVNIGGIAGVVHPNGTRLALRDVHADAANAGKNLPLIDVTEIDEQGLLTERKYAYSRGDGYLTVVNPFIQGEKILCLDSRDYRKPRRECSL